ncbi:MAG: cation-translocating P-type ATPase [Candidatus Saccharimonadales bacterium]
MKTKVTDFYRLDASEVIKSLESDKHGLSGEEASQRLRQLGPNKLAKLKQVPAIVIFLQQFKNLLVLLLLASATIAIFALHNPQAAVILLAIGVINASVGFIQEHKAETLLASLHKLVVAQTKVIRGGKMQEIASSQLVVGDVIYLAEGDSVPADARILDEQELATKEFALTGESDPIRKFAHAMEAPVPLPSRHNLLFMGTTVATGQAHAVIIATGMATELGRIASLSRTTKPGSSPLQKEMNHLAKRLTQGTILLAIILTLVALSINLRLHDALLFAIGISAAMIPSGLVAEVNITLAQAASRMAKAKALVKKLSAVETLGACNIIATDKTGTLTKNQMTVEQIVVGETVYKITGTGYKAEGEIQTARGQAYSKKELEDLKLFFAAGAMASNAKVNPPDEEHNGWYCVGDPTEGAIITLARKAGVEPEKLDEKYSEIKEFQFDSARKRMSSVRRYGSHIAVFVKGAPESVLEKSSEIWDHGHTRKLHKKDLENLNKYNEDEAKNARRNLGVAYKLLPADYDTSKLKMSEIESDLTWLGMVSMVDPLRSAVPAAMAAARNAHVKVSVVTGDYPATAKAIAQAAGLEKSDEEITVVLGEDLQKLSDAAVLKMVKTGGVIFSRVAPEDKMRIVDLTKKSGLVVAVTGDGINDAPALKRADIGVAMGKSGTDVAKNAAEIILLDDSFKTLVGAIKQGRLTYQNIRKAARCALTDNAGELITILFSLAGDAIFHVPIAITAVQVLAIDVVAQIFPITALGWDKAENNLMNDKPRDLHDHIINRKTVSEFVGFGMLAAVLAYGNFLWFFARHGVSAVRLGTSSHIYAQATILTYLTIVLCQFINLLMVRSDRQKSFFGPYLWSNKKLLLAFAVSFFLIANIIYNPWISSYFGAGSLSLADVGTAILAAAIYLSVRLSQRHTRQHSRHAVLKLHREIHQTKIAGLKI